VRVGKFSDRAEADKFRRDVQRELGGKPMIMQVQ
jgi:hypothetical protein